MNKFTQQTQAQRPVAPPIDLGAGRLDVRQAALAGGFVLGALLVAASGAGVAWSSWSSWDRPILLVATGGAVALVALIFGTVVLYVSVSEWLDHRSRIADWHAVALDAYADAGGSETVQQVSQFEFSTSRFADVLLTAMQVHWRVNQRELYPYSSRKLYGPLFLANRRIGTLSKFEAEEMSGKLAQLGLIEGRGPGQAGDWRPQNADEVLDILVRNWS